MESTMSFNYFTLINFKDHGAMSSFQKVRDAQAVWKFPAVYGTQRVITMLATAGH
jgi:hypothetical protein